MQRIAWAIVGLGLFLGIARVAVALFAMLLFGTARLIFDLLHEPALDAQNSAALVDVQSSSHNAFAGQEGQRLAVILRL